MTSSTNPPSGFSVLLHSRAMQALGRFWKGLNGFARPLVPLLHLFMLVAIGLILFGVVFANRFLPWWGDESYMTEPAFHRATEGVWRSAYCLDSVDTIPYAPNYPLLCNILRVLIACFGFNFWILRGAMLVIGLVPVAVLLCLFRRNGLLQSFGEVIQAAFFAACFTFFAWTFAVRPEPVLLFVVALLASAWSADRPVLLFFSALLVPACGLHWNVLLLPAMLHWLVFGGRIRRPILLAAAFLLSSAGTVVAYHVLGMWPSYLQEAARVGGLDALRAALGKLHAAYSAWDFSWILHRASLPPVSVLCLFFSFVLAALSAVSRRSTLSHRRLCLFLFLSLPAVILAMALFGHMSWSYVPPILLFPALCLPAIARPLFQSPVVLLASVLFALYPVKVNWDKTATRYSPRFERLTDASWNDEAGLECALRSALSPDEVVCCGFPAYPAVRAVCRDLYPVCFAFDLTPGQRRAVGAVLLENHPFSMLKDGSKFRRASYTEAMCARFCPPGADPDAIHVFPDELLAAIGERWNCAFSEVPFDQPERPGFVRYRLFRTDFDQAGDDRAGGEP